MKEITITKIQEGQRLDRFLGKCLPGASRSFLYKMLRKKNIKLNEAKADGSEKLSAGDRIQIYFSDETYAGFAGAKGGDHNAREEAGRTSHVGRDQGSSTESDRLRKEVRILYKDEDILILHKPAGMLTQKSSPEDDSLNDYLLDLCRREKWLDEEALTYFHPSVANRLDRNTSGIVLCGISMKGLQQLSSALRDRSLEKYYLTLVAGKVTRPGSVRGYLSKDREKNKVFFSTHPLEGGAPVETEYEPVSCGEEVSLLKVRLITGKSHQIRVHLASEGFPILGDNKYGDRRINRKLKMDLGISGQLLHSYEIGFGRHLEGMKVRDPMPESFVRVMDYFGLEIPERP